MSGAPLPGPSLQPARAKPGARPRRRRTQQERRAATRAALLDATIDCIVEYGYANTTLARIVERAGVSRGAQTYHFPTKAELVSDALGQLAHRQAREILHRVEALPEGPTRFDAALDLIWEIHLGPLFQAALELFVAARTDPELRAGLNAVERDVDRVIASGAARAFGPEAVPPGFSNALELALAAMRGLALLTAARGEDRSDIEARWRATRPLLPRLLG